MLYNVQSIIHTLIRTLGNPQTEHGCILPTTKHTTPATHIHKRQQGWSGHNNRMLGSNHQPFVWRAATEPLLHLKRSHEPRDAVVPPFECAFWVVEVFILNVRWTLLTCVFLSLTPQKPRKRGRNWQQLLVIKYQHANVCTLNLFGKKYDANISCPPK